MNNETNKEMNKVHFSGVKPCSNNPCQNGGTCEELSSTDYKCTCPYEREGKMCEQGCTAFLLFLFAY